MTTKNEFELILAQRDAEEEPVSRDPGASPFKVVIDPSLRLHLRQALVELIEQHEETLARYVTDGHLSLDSYKEYIELFARSLKETMESREGVAYLLRSAGFEIDIHNINLNPEWRWKNADNE